jgi:catechol 2,3-dioxygenase-like lactoylglutathione lyase family enzyme
MNTIINSWGNAKSLGITVMSGILVGLMLLAVPIATYAGGHEAAQTSDKPYVGSTFGRVNIVVSDMERALRLYRDILGFRMDILTVSPPTSFSYPLFNVDKDVQLRRAFLSGGNKQPWTIALTEVEGVKPYTPPSPFRSALVIDAPGPVEELKAKLAAEGIKVDADWDIPEPAFAARRDLSFTDHDGHRLVVFVMSNPE